MARSGRASFRAGAKTGAGFAPDLSKASPGTRQRRDIATAVARALGAHTEGPFAWFAKDASTWKVCGLRGMDARVPFSVGASDDRDDVTAKALKWLEENVGGFNTDGRIAFEKRRREIIAARSTPRYEKRCISVSGPKYEQLKEIRKWADVSWDRMIIAALEHAERFGGNRGEP